VSKRSKLKKLMHKRELEGQPTVVICVGKKCADRSESRAVRDLAIEYAAATHPEVHIETTGCLHICKKGPIAASYPKIRFKKKVGEKRVKKLIDRVAP
jgi:(2Fe-2S) ferredoxin